MRDISFIEHAADTFEPKRLIKILGVTLSVDGDRPGAVGAGILDRPDHQGLADPLAAVRRQYSDTLYFDHPIAGIANSGGPGGNRVESRQILSAAIVQPIEFERRIHALFVTKHRVTNGERVFLIRGICNFYDLDSCHKGFLTLVRRHCTKPRKRSKGCVVWTGNRRRIML